MRNIMYHLIDDELNYHISQDSSILFHWILFLLKV